MGKRRGSVEDMGLRLALVFNNFTASAEGTKIRIDPDRHVHPRPLSFL